MLVTRFRPWAPTVWDPFGQLHNEVNRIFERFDNARTEAAVLPALNLWERDDVYHLEAEIPGIDLADLDITVTGLNQLTIKGQRKPPVSEAVAHRQERMFGSFSRTVTLPTAVDADKVEARLENGVLRIVLPKHEVAKPRRIAVKS